MKMNIKNLKEGDKVFIREDLVHLQEYGNAVYYNTKGSSEKTIAWFHNDNKDTFVTEENNCYYTVEMIDWEKTAKLNNLSCFKKITQYGECGNEMTKATMYDGREITVKNNNEENDIEKAVMMLMLKARGVTYGDVKKEVEKVKAKWMPKKGEKYYWINPYFEINWRIWQELRLDRKLLESNNCFQTEQKAEEKLDKIKEVLRGE